MAQQKRLPRGIDLRPNGQYRARLTVEGKQVNLGRFFSEADAEAALAIARGQVASRTFVSPSDSLRMARERATQGKAEEVAERYTVARLYEDWMDWGQRRGLKEGSLYSMRSRWNSRIRETFSGVPVRDVTADMVRAWHDKIVAEGKPGSARESLAALSQMFAFAAGTAAPLPAGHRASVDENPCRISAPGRSKPVRAPHREVATPEEVADLASRMPEGEQLSVLLAAWCGLRIGEVLGLRRRDLWTAPPLREGEPEATFLRIERQVQSKGGLREETTKSRAGTRDVPVPAALLPAVRAHLRDHAGMGDDGLLFPAQVRGTRWLHPNTLRERFKVARDAHNAEQAEVERPQLTGFVFHDLRKTALTTVGRAGATGAELMRFGGHADLETVQVYQRADLDRLARLADLMDADVQLPGAGLVTPIRRDGVA